jgi:hypothetical protein
MADGSPYEVLTQEIFQNILDQTAVKNVEVRHNVELVGKTTKHHIDVYWEFEVGGVVYATVIQAKDWVKSVDQGELLKFKGVLDDLPGQPRGVFVTRTGYQSGAVDVARANGILLLQLEEVVLPSGPFAITGTTLGYVLMRINPTPLLVAGAKREGRTFIMEAIVYEPEFEESLLYVDPAWMCEKFGSSRDEIQNKITAMGVSGLPHDMKLYDEEGNEVSDVQRIYKGFVAELRGKESTSQRMSHTFETPIYIRVSNFELPLIKILSITSTVTIREKERLERPFRLPNIVQFVLRNLSDGTARLVGRRTS